MNTENTTATSKVNHAGDSTTQSTKQDTGVGSGDWLGSGLSYGEYLTILRHPELSDFRCDTYPKCVARAENPITVSEENPLLFCYGDKVVFKYPLSP